MLILSTWLLGFLSVFTLIEPPRVTGQVSDICSVSAFDSDYPGLFERTRLYLGDEYEYIWCGYWIAACTYYSYYCPSTTCRIYVSIDTSDITMTNLDLSCYVDVAPSLVPPGAVVPKDGATRANPANAIGVDNGNAGGPGTGYGSGPLGSGASIEDVPIPPFRAGIPLENENVTVSNAVLIVTAVLVAVGAIGAGFSMNSSPGSGGGTATAAAKVAVYEKPQFYNSNGIAHQPTSASPPKTPVLTDGVDPVLLLLHFQFISSTGFLSLSYPLRYLGFTYHFSFANFISPLVTMAAEGMSDVCYYKGNAKLGAGFLALAHRYNLEPALLGGMVNLGVILAFAMALGVVGLLSIFAILFANLSGNGTMRRLGANWPPKASNFTLRMCLWVWGTVTTFSFYQFFFPCPLAPALVISSVDFAIILSALLAASILILRTADKHGVEKMYSTEEEESPYANRWGSVYASFKKRRYTYFIADYIWVLGRGGITAFGQANGLIQVSILGGLELAVFLFLVFMRPYESGWSNAFHIGFAFTRLSSTGLLVGFLPGLTQNENLKEHFTTVIIVITIAYAGAVGMYLVLKAVIGIIAWFKKRRQQGSAVQ
ncbi:hypothetical protein FA15DRAFT_758862 [Coprinopsis marcescibilis]|uniref:TRP C-terminal domain-containing protein n=1 Tax=Coprinopsis marcescibilis TaxID=230819 RepID=A0A5C3KZ63_COPMA|nr:hypothetical protein FA15DRAFT_758862 [Coprinopsis marcescibilis]